MTGHRMLIDGELVAATPGLEDVLEIKTIARP